MTPSTARADDDLADLLVAVAESNRHAFARFYDRTAARVYGLVLSIVRDAGYAEEVMQETYLQVWSAADRFVAGRGSALSWVMTIAHRRAVDRIRAEESAHRRDTKYFADDGSRTAGGVAETVVAQLDSVEVRLCLNTLTATQRQSIELSYFGGMTYPQVARHLDAGLPAVKSRIRDGLRRLRECLEAGGV